MSTLKVDNIRHNNATSDAITMASDGTCSAKLTSVGGEQLSNRNKVINGGMTVSQRGTSFSHSSSAAYTVDRFQHRPSGSPTFECTYTQSDDHPDGFSKSLKTTPNTADTSLLTSDNAMIRYMFEGQDLQDLAYGTSSAKSITLSFYAKSGSQNNNHQYSVQFRKNNDGGAARKIVTAAFTVTTSWQRYTFTFAGDTGENIRNDAENGLELMWHLAAGPDDIHPAQSTWSSTTNAASAGSPKFTAVNGQSNFLDNTNNEFYLTGVQVEVGDIATSFEHRSHGEELARCQRYFVIFPGRSGGVPFWQAYMGASYGYCSLPIPFSMRAVPSPTDPSTGTTTSSGHIYDASGNQITGNFGGQTTTLSCAGNAPSGLAIIMSFGNHSSGNKNGVVASWNGGSPGIYLDAEL